MMVLASDVYGSSNAGIPVVNRLVVEAARRGGIEGVVISLNDDPAAKWLMEWPDSTAAGGSRLKFLMAALSRSRHGRDSVILATHCGLVSVGRLVKNVSGGRLCTLLLGVEAWQRLPARTLWGLRGCDLIVAISQFTLDEFHARNPEMREIESAICHLPARNLEPLDVASSNGQRALDGALRVVVVGRLWGRGMQKGQRQLISIWPRLLEVAPRAELVIVGEGDGRGEFEQLALKLDLGKRVQFTGYVTDTELGAIYRSADVYAMPSRGEGFGLVFAEAMSYGLPCIASAFDAGREVVVDGETGFHVDPDNDESILRSLVTLALNRDLRCRMGEAGRERARTMFDVDRFDARIQAVLRGSVLAPGVSS